LGNGVEAIVESETGRCQRWAAIVGESASDGATVAPYDLGLWSGASLHSPFPGAHTADMFFEDLLGMTVGLIDWLGGFVQGVKVTQLVGNLR